MVAAREGEPAAAALPPLQYEPGAILAHLPQPPSQPPPPPIAAGIVPLIAPPSPPAAAAAGGGAQHEEQHQGEAHVAIPAGDRHNDDHANDIAMVPSPPGGAVAAAAPIAAIGGAPLAALIDVDIA